MNSRAAGGKRRPLSCRDELVLRRLENNRAVKANDPSVRRLMAEDLVTLKTDGCPTPTVAGRAHLACTEVSDDAEIGMFRAQHLKLGRASVPMDGRMIDVLIDECESPLAWLARRKGRDGVPMIDTAQFMAGERLRADFTRAQMTPRVTSNWSSPMSSGGRRPPSDPSALADHAMSARQRVRQTLAAVGPEFAGLLMDVCCFLRGLEDIERTRGWPQRSAKIVLQLALDRLARHYGLARCAEGAQTQRLRSWLADDVELTCDIPDDNHTASSAARASR